MAEARYIRNLDTDVVFAYTERLDKLSHMVECDKDGNQIVAKRTAKAPKVEEKTELDLAVEETVEAVKEDVKKQKKDTKKTGK